MPDALPVLSDLGFRLLSLLDVQQIGLQIAYGGIVIMTLFGIALASNAIRRHARRHHAAPAGGADCPDFGDPQHTGRNGPRGRHRGQPRGAASPPNRVVNDDLLLLCEEATDRRHGEAEISTSAGRSLVDQRAGGR